MEKRIWLSVHDILDEHELDETDRASRMLTQWVDEPAYLPVTDEDRELVTTGERTRT